MLLMTFYDVNLIKENQNSEIPLLYAINHLLK
jgi:hypothetical protein